MNTKKSTAKCTIMAHINHVNIKSGVLLENIGKTPLAPNKPLKDDIIILSLTKPKPILLIKVAKSIGVVVELGSAIKNKSHATTGKK